MVVLSRLELARDDGTHLDLIVMFLGEEGGYFHHQNGTMMPSREHICRDITSEDEDR